MRTLNRNKKTIYYALHMGTEPVYKTDDDGNIVMRNGKPVKTGEHKPKYGTPVQIKSSISFSGGEIQPVEFGIDYSSYDAQLILKKGSTPIKEMALIWYTSEVEYEDDGTTVKPLSADYTVKRKSPSLNYDKFLLSRIVKNETD